MITVNDATIHVVCHGIDGKIPSGQILFQASGKGHCLGMPPILVNAVYPIGGYLKGSVSLSGFLGAKQNRHGAMLDSRINGTQKKGFYDLRFGRSRNIPVFRFSSQKGVPNTSSDSVGFVACLLNLSNNEFYPFGNGDLYCFRIFHPFSFFNMFLSVKLVHKVNPVIPLNRTDS